MGEVAIPMMLIWYKNIQLVWLFDRYYQQDLDRYIKPFLNSLNSPNWISKSKDYEWNVAGEEKVEDLNVTQKRMIENYFKI